MRKKRGETHADTRSLLPSFGAEPRRHSPLSPSALKTYQNSPLHLASGVPGLTGPSSSALLAWLYLALSFFASCASCASATRRIVSDPA